MSRAVHLLRDDDPKILIDPFARGLAGYESDEALAAAYDEHPMSRWTGWHTQFVVRSRYTEDVLEGAIREGISQYVMLGAGLDSFAYRRPDLMVSLDGYEVDQPMSQQFKRERVAALGLKTPVRLRHVPVDFEREALGACLLAAGFDRARPAYFSWLGVTSYLKRNAIVATLREITELATVGASIALTFIAPPSTLEGEDADVLRRTMAGAARVGEPWVSFFTPPEMTALLKDAGFRAISCFGPRDAHERYLAGRTDGLRLPGYWGMATASTMGGLL
jgi:methyltransferase (TIGR00027 family)